MFTDSNSSRSVRLSLPAVLAELSQLADAHVVRRAPGPVLRAVVQEALREGTYVVPQPLVMSNTLIWFD